MTTLGRPTLLLVLAAFALRLYRLDVPSLWHDEGLSWYAARSVLAGDLQAYLTAAPDHPPLYFLGLGLWMRLAGESDFALRFFSLLPGVLLVALTYRTGKALGGPGPARWAAALVAISPLYLYHSQEVRMYSWAVILALAAWHAFWKALGGGAWRWWVAWGLATFVAFLTHYASVFTTLAQMALLGLAQMGLTRGWIEPLPWRRLGAALVTQGAAAAAAIAFWWGMVMPLSLVYGKETAGTGLGEIVRRTGVFLSLGPGVEKLVSTSGQTLTPEEGWGVALLMVPFLMAAIASFGPRQYRRPAVALAVTCLLVPVAAIWLISWGRRDFTPRYLMMLSPAFFWLLGMGLANLWRRWIGIGGAITLLLMGTMGYSLGSLYFDPRYARDDYRGLVRYLEDRDTGRDAVILNAGFIYPTIEHYARGSLSLSPMPAPLADPEEVDERLKALAARYQRLWLVLWQDYYADPDSLVRGWLDSHAFPMDAQGFGGLALYGYTTRQPVYHSAPPIQYPVILDLDGEVGFLGYDLDTSQLASRKRVGVTLFWESRGPTTASLSAYVNLVDRDWRRWGGSDHQPAYDRLPTTAWEKGMVIADEREIRLSEDLPPGAYRLAVGAYDPTTGRSLRISETGEERFYLGPFLWPPDPAIPASARPVGKVVGGLAELAAFELGEARPGEELPLVLYWRPLTTTQASYSVFAHLYDVEGHLVAQQDNQPLRGGYPTPYWQPGQIIRDPYLIKLPEGLAPRRYRLAIGMYEDQSGKRLPWAETREGAIIVAEVELR